MLTFAQPACIGRRQKTRLRELSFCRYAEKGRPFSLHLRFVHTSNPISYLLFFQSNRVLSNSYPQLFFNSKITNEAFAKVNEQSKFPGMQARARLLGLFAFKPFSTCRMYASVWPIHACVPTGHFANLEPQKVWIAEFVLHKNYRSTDFMAL